MNAFHAGHYEEEFFDRIRENLNEDWPRLQYADWLEEQGRCEHAEYIKLSCELASTPDIDNNTRDKKQTRMRELRIGYSHTWTDFLNIANVFELHYFSDYEYEPEVSAWSRGFISSIALPGLDRYASTARKIIHALPGLEPEGIRFKTKVPAKLSRHDDDDSKCCWWLGPTKFHRDPSALPSYLFKMMSKHTHEEWKLVRKDYANMQEAIADLSRAAYQYGRFRLALQDAITKGDV